MPTRILFLIAFITVSIITSGQQTTTLKKTLELAIPRTGGANGAGVAWHPDEKKYYASMAGNAGFPLVRI
ncbi:MAG: hypothetical protein HC867_00880 [Bacteroidia bacterium]|nr:hypothetical protein [Bacteroidia bacterium]